MAFTLKFIAWLTAINVYEHVSYADKLQFWKVYISITVAIISMVFLAFYILKKNAFIGIGIFISILIMFLIGPPLAIAFHLIPPLWIIPYSLIVIYLIASAIWRAIARRTKDNLVTRSILKIDLLFKWFWKCFPIAVVVAFVFGVISAVSGNAELSPYAASIGFVSYVIYYVFRLFRRKEQ